MSPPGTPPTQTGYSEVPANPPIAKCQPEARVTDERGLRQAVEVRGAGQRTGGVLIGCDYKWGVEGCGRGHIGPSPLYAPRAVRV